MTPKEKAQELLEKFQSISGHTRFSKAYALIAVDEIIEATKVVVDRPDFNGIVFNTYWKQVKTEIEAL